MTHLVVMASDDAGSRPSLFMIIPNTKCHPNDTKTDQLPISEVITGLPRPYYITPTTIYAVAQTRSFVGNTFQQSTRIGNTYLNNKVTTSKRTTLKLFDSC